MTRAYLAFTEKGLALAQKLAGALPGTVDRCGHGGPGLADWAAEQFAHADALIFVGAVGIAVRAIAPHCRSKAVDPAVVVLDECGHFAVPILSGHLGGANDLVRALAAVCGAVPVITTATDANGVFAVDEWARHQNCAVLEPERIKLVSGALLAGKTVALMFSKASTRTRTSFEVGVYQLGGLGNYMNAATELQSGRGEPLKDTARVLGRYYDCVVWRTYRQCDLEEFAELAGVPVINGLTDYAHPCQVLADLMTIRERRGTLEGQKLCFIGDGCSMANSLIVGGLLAGMRVTCVCPEGYRPAADVLMFAHKYGEKFHLLTDPAEGVKDADVVVTSAWNTAPGTPESERRLRDFAGFQVTSRLMEGAKPDAMLLHCLPAHRGEEISTAVFEEHADEIFDEAENRLHVQKAVLAILLAGL